jgi:hypothetical protein
LVFTIVREIGGGLSRIETDPLTTQVIISKTLLSHIFSCRPSAERDLPPHAQVISLFLPGQGLNRS